MSEEVLEQIISSYMTTSQMQYGFGWQGGEPTLMGVDFFRRVIELQKKHGRDGSSVANGLQTNAVLIDDEFAAHLAKYNFLTGVSIDGPPEMHDRFRLRADGYGSHADVLRGIGCLKRNKAEFNALTLVSSANIAKGKEVYNYLLDIGIDYHQYIPCVEFDPQGNPMPWTIGPEAWGDFLCEVFDEWMHGGVGKVSVRLFDSIFNLLAAGVRGLCHMCGDCRQYFVVEHNGDVYPCDFFVTPELKLGNVTADSWEELQASSKYETFGKQKVEWNDECDSCGYLTYCAGDCLKHRMYSMDSSPDKQSWLCKGWKQFFAHSLDRFKALVCQFRENSALHIPHSALKGVGRNDPCPCRSGLKYKKCHGAG